MAIEKGTLATAAANGANEVANKMFREGKISFLEIGDLVMGAMLKQESGNPNSVDDVLEADKIAREYVLSNIN